MICGHAPTALRSDCRYCRHVAAGGRYAELFRNPPPAAAGVAGPRPPDPPPCRHRSDPLTGRGRESRGLDHARAWHLCERPGFRLVSLPVCGCTGCNPTCDGYEADPG